MPAPASVPEFLDLVQKSGVADEAKLKAYLDKIGGLAALPPEPPKAAGHLVRDGLLTFFQAEQILQGKWKRFSIGKYKVLERLGSGGMGQVFLCEHKLMRRRVAVKVLPTTKAADESSLARFNREARAAAALDHPNIVRAFDIDQDDNLHFLVMEYVDGTNLQDLVKKAGPLDPVRACHYVYGAAVGLQHAHEIGMVHRDIKPGNILLDRAGVVKVLDMGLARLTYDTDDHITRKYDENILGTADYLSPEQAEDSHTVDIRSDIYSLGATFYYLLTGSQPFPEGTIPQKLIWHRSRQPKPIRETRPDVPEAVAAVVTRMMAKKPGDRYQNPSEVMAALQPWVSIPIPPPRDQEMPQLSPAVAAALGNRPAVSAARAAGPALLVGSEPGSGVRITSSQSMAYGQPTSLEASEAPTVPLERTPAAGVWESLDESPPPGSGDTGRASQTVPEARPTRPRPAAPRDPARRTKLPLVLAVVGAVVLLGGGVGAYLVFFNKKPTEVGNQPVPAPTTKRLVVSKAKAGAENVFPTLGKALTRASAGDTIAVEEPTLKEGPVRVSRRDLTIESALPDGQRVNFELESDNPVDAAIEVGGVEGFRLKGFVINAQGVAEHAVKLSGNLPGAALENVTVLGGKKGGVRLLNATGQSGRPMTFDRVRFVGVKDQEAGFKVETGGNLTARALLVRNCRFEGPGSAGVRFDGPADAAEVTGSRFYQLDAALSVARPGDRLPLKLTVTQNTVVDCKVGLLVTGPPGGSPVVALAVNRNYFARVPEALARADGDLPGLTAAQNARAPDANGGNLDLHAVEINPAPGLPTNPDDDATFLRFGGGGPTVNGRRVGVE
ncbi:protein kinase [bacterium]|nr:protein kinase [bacterium]